MHKRIMIRDNAKKILALAEELLNPDITMSAALTKKRLVDIAHEAVAILNEMEAPTPLDIEECKRCYYWVKNVEKGEKEYCYITDVEILHVRCPQLNRDAKPEKKTPVKDSEFIRVGIKNVKIEREKPVKEPKFSKIDNKDIEEIKPETDPGVIAVDNILKILKGYGIQRDEE